MRLPMNLPKNVFPLLTLVVLVALAYHNAQHDQWVLDDIRFDDMASFGDPSNIPRYFTERLRSVSSGGDELYRPLLLVSVAVDATLFPGDKVAWHRSNIFYHAIAVLLLYLVLNRLLQRLGYWENEAVWAALLGASLFAIHPVNTEVVNSVFNRSYMLACIGSLAAMWVLLRLWPERRILAWFISGLIYFVSMFSNETVIVLPGILAVLVATIANGSLFARARQMLPVFWMLLPMSLYLLIRENAIELQSVTALPLETGPATQPEVTAIDSGLDLGTRFSLAINFWTRALIHSLWPSPILISYGMLLVQELWVAVIVQFALLALVLVAMSRRVFWPALAAALFYLPLLPVSRLMGDSNIGAHLADRYLYLPLVGLVLIVTLGMAFLVRKGYLKAAILVSVVICSIFTVQVWARNDLWQDTYTLTRSDSKRVGSSLAVRLYTAAIVDKGAWEEGGKVCDARLDAQGKNYQSSANCGVIYMSLGRMEDAERTLLRGTRDKLREVPVRLNLATVYLVLQRPDDASEQYDLAMKATRNPADREFLKALSLVSLYPGDPEKRRVAVTHLDRALELQPGHLNALAMKNQLVPQTDISKGD